MKLSLLNILKEEITPKLKNKLDTVADWFINDLTIQKEPYEYSTGNRLILLDDSTPLDIYVQRIMDDDVFINKLGWERNTNDMNTDSFYVKDGEVYDEEDFEDEITQNYNIHIYPPSGYPMIFVYWDYSDQKYYLESDALSIIENKIKKMYDFPYEWIKYIVKSIIRKIGEKLSIDFGIDIDLNHDDYFSLNESIIDDFIEFGKKELLLGDDFKINLTDNGDNIETLANYDMGTKEINVLTKNRAIPDIIRSIAHEMVHHNQNDRGDLRGVPEEGEVGSPWEDEANTKAGQLVRKFGDINPEIYDL
jgi:hypothetical protein